MRATATFSAELFEPRGVFGRCLRRRGVPPGLEASALTSLGGQANT